MANSPALSTRFDIARTLKLEPGRNELAIVIRDSEGLLAESRQELLFQRPWFRSSWFLLTSSGVLAAAAAALWLRRIARRRRLLQRRFNPFVAGAPILHNDLFFGRESTIERILQTLASNNILVHGERRIGKTSLLHQISDRLLNLRDPDLAFVPVYADVEGVSETDLFHVLTEDVIEAFRTFGVTVDRNDQRLGGEDAEALIQTSESLLLSFRKNDGPSMKIALLIDEADQLLTYSRVTRDQLRRLLLGPLGERLVMVLSGVGIGTAAADGNDAFLALFDRLELRGLAIDDAERLIRDPLRGVFRLDESVVIRLLELSRRKPYLIQRMCVALVNRCHELGKRTIEVADVDLLHASGVLGSSPTSQSGS